MVSVSLEERKTHAAGGEFVTDLGVVVEFAVVGDGVGGVGLAEEHGLWLAGRRGIDHGETAVGEHELAGGGTPQPRAIRPAVRQASNT